MDKIDLRPFSGTRPLLRGVAIAAGLVCMLAALPSSAAAAWLGVSVQDLSPPLAEAMDMRETTGVLVTDVAPAGPADRSGVHVRDVIVAVDGSAVETSRELVALLEAHAPGDRVTLRVWRGAHPMDLEAVLAESHPDLGRQTPQSTDRAERGDHPQAPPVLSVLGGPQIGIDVFPLNTDLAAALGVNAADGVLVLRVREDSPAERAGLKAGDVLRIVNGRVVHEIGDIRDALRPLGANATWKAEILRGGRRMSVEGRIEPGWQLPGGESRLAPRQGLGKGSVWEQRQLRELNREIERLRDRIGQLERRLRRSERR
jgi:predicted metalloprotease with PDZ domain